MSSRHRAGQYETPWEITMDNVMENEVFDPQFGEHEADELTNGRQRSNDSDKDNYFE
ncbi:MULTISPECIES: hypothetical protein [Streptomycetaceae]|uniref:hypothetical protein n=1 Tax=Streptomycetaceae TaxID=2062 RepID=UPI002E7A7EF1|nr:hypothetical protein [Streptomyces sp. BE20]MEE1820725.1 hypothetical protein [Streptomyces sp. BE20]